MVGVWSGRVLPWNQKKCQPKAQRIGRLTNLFVWGSGEFSRKKATLDRRATLGRSNGDNFRWASAVLSFALRHWSSQLACCCQRSGCHQVTNEDARRAGTFEPTPILNPARVLTSNCLHVGQETALTSGRSSIRQPGPNSPPAGHWAELEFQFRFVFGICGVCLEF